MRHSPEHAVFSPDQVTANMVQARRPPRTQSIQIIFPGRRPIRETGMHFNMVQQWRAPAVHAFPIELISADWHRTRRPFCVEQQKERQKHRNIARHGSKRLFRNALARCLVARRLRIVLRPAIIEAEANVLKQIGHPEILCIGHGRMAATEHPFNLGRFEPTVKIDVRLDGR
jgi:hypothetical protein